MHAFSKESDSEGADREILPVLQIFYRPGEYAQTANAQREAKATDTNS